MIRPARVELVHKIVRLARLPDGKSTRGYLTSNQLSLLVYHLEVVHEQLKTLQKGSSDDASQKE